MKKGNIFFEGITILVVVVVFVILAVVGNNVYDSVNTEIQADPDVSTEAKDMLGERTTEYPKIIDGMVVFLIVGLWIAAVAFAYFIETSPLFFIISVILLVIVLVIGAILSNAFQELTTEEGLTDAPTAFPMSYFIISHIVETLLVITISIAIALFAKQ